MQDHFVNPYVLLPVRRYLGLIVLVCFSQFNQIGSAQAKPTEILIEGTVVDATGKSVDTGSVRAAFASPSVEDVIVDIKNGVFKIKQTLKPKERLPLMAMLTIHVTIKKMELPPHTIAHLSPRRAQMLHIVVYTDSQLQKANVGELLDECQQLETSLFVWSQADAKFKQKFREYYSISLFERRRTVIVRALKLLISEKQLDERQARHFLAKLSDKGPIDFYMKTTLERKD